MKSIASLSKLTVVKQTIGEKKAYVVINSEDDNKNIYCIAEYINDTMKNKELTKTALGSGVHGTVWNRRNQYSTVVCKTTTSNDAIQVDRYADLLKILSEKNFQKKYGCHFNIPFFVGSGSEDVKKPKLLMSKINGKSLEALVPFNRVVKLSKKQIKSLYNAMKIMAKRFCVVHTDVHAGNIMLEDVTNLLILIDFDECMFREAKPITIKNPEYNSDPYEPGDKYIIDTENVQSKFNPECYVTKSEFEYLESQMLKNFRDMFLIEGKSIFSCENFEDSSDDDEPLNIYIPSREAMPGYKGPSEIF